MSLRDDAIPHLRRVPMMAAVLLTWRWMIMLVVGSGIAVTPAAHAATSIKGERTGGCQPAHGWQVVLKKHAKALKAGPRALKPFALEADDMSLMLNEFSRESDLQVLFDFNVLHELKSCDVDGHFTAAEALFRLLYGTNLTYDFVNDHTLAVTPKKPSVFSRLVKPHRNTQQSDYEDDLNEVLISKGAGTSSLVPALGAQQISFDRLAIERSGAVTVPDFLRPIPQVFGGGPTQDTVLGREAASNAMHGEGINLRGLQAGATQVLFDGQPLAPSGSSASWVDISWIPLSIVSRIDLLMDGAGARYGADAIGGVANFKLRSTFTGLETQVRAGGVTDGPTKEQDVSQLGGFAWQDGHGIVAAEYFHRDALPASSRIQATSDLRALGGSNFDLPYGNPGTLIADGQTYALPRNQNGSAINPASLVAGTQNFTDQWQGAWVLPEERRVNLLTSLHQELDHGYAVFLNAMVSDRAVTSHAAAYSPTLTVTNANPFYINPAGGTAPVAVLYSFGRDFGNVTTDAHDRTGNVWTGVNWEGASGWKAGASLGYSVEHERQINDGYADPTKLAAALADPNPIVAFNAFADGSFTNPTTLTGLRAQTFYAGDSSLKLLRLRAEGPILAIGGGNIRLATGFDYRDQVFDSQVLPLGGVSPQREDLGRHLLAGFTELRVPIFGKDNALPGIERLEGSAALRHDQYSDVGGTTTPHFGWTWAPIKSVELRGTWSKVFRPPNLPDRVENNNLSGILPLANAAGGQTPTLIWAGNNADLKAERGRTWTLGLDFHSNAVPGLSFGTTYFDTRLIDRTESMPFSLAALADPAYAALVTPDPTAAQRATVCSRSAFQGVSADCLAAPIGAILDLRLRNAATLITRGIDFTGDYRLTQWVPGTLDLGLLATNLFEFSRADSPGGPLQALLNTQNQPVDLRFRASAEWDYHRLGVGASVNYTDAYRQFITDSTRTVPSWTTVDLRLSWELGDPQPGGTGTQFALHVQNLTNRAPPFLNNPIGVGYDQENADLLGRFVSFTMKVRW